MQILRIAIVLLTALGGIIFLIKLTPSMSKLLVNRSEPHFPVVTGYNLERRQFEFPRDFEGEFNLVIVPFQRYHQAIVDTWIPTAQQIEADFPVFMYYELPTLTTMSPLYRTFLNEGMRAGIPDTTARQRTITLYLDKDLFKSALDIPSENDIYLFLVNTQGEILWRTTGEFTQDKAESLLEYLRENTKSTQVNRW
jgi:hypothetical protein